MFRSPYVNRPNRHRLSCSEPSQTKQEFKDSCDINRIMGKYLRGQQLPPAEPGLYGDFSDVGDFQQAQGILLHARAQFDALPALTRDRFQNSPEAMLRFVADPKNKDELRALGLSNPLPPPPVKAPPMEVVVVDGAVFKDKV